MDDPISGLPQFSLSRLGILVTGSISAALVPYWLHWLRLNYEEVTTSVILTRNAERFVTLDAVRQLIDGPAFVDSWDEVSELSGGYVEIEAMSDCFAVFPATLNTTMRLAGGFTDTPALMALQATSKPVVVAPAFPATNLVIDAQIERLLLRPNVAFSATVPAFSVGTQTWSGRTGLNMPLVFEAFERLTCNDAGQSRSAS